MDKTLGWMALPDELRPHNYDIRRISLQETEQLFKKADKLGVLDKFAELFWDTVGLAHQSKPSLQEAVKLLEKQKRLIGRRYDKTSSNTPDNVVKRCYIAAKYNEIEYQIRWMVKMFELTRTSEPYLLEVK